jgi:hypothetical protein
VLTRIAELEALLAFVPTEVTELENEWKTIQERLEELDKSQESLTAELKANQTAFAEISKQSEKFEKDLHLVTNNKEYNAVLKEIDGAKTKIHALEEDAAKKKAALKEVEHNREEVGTLGKESKSKYQKALSDYRATQKESEKELTGLNKEREKLAKNVPLRLMRQFTRIADRRSGVGLALCVNAVCQGCNVRVRQNIVDELRRFERLIICESCKRILFFEDHQ